MAATQRVWFINDNREVVNWSTVVVGGVATTRIRRAVETTRTVDGVTQKSELATYIWANPGDKITATQVATAQNQASSDALPPPPTPATTTPTVTAETGYDIFLLIGQSNMAGRGTDINVARLDFTDPRILQYATAGTYANQISLAVDPLGHMDATQATNAGVGPAMEFARLYTMSIPTNRKVLLVPSAWGGTGFLTDSSQGGGSLRWKTTTTGTNGLYQRSVNSAKAALAAAPAGSRIVGALWLQGEQDSDPSTDKTAYRTEFEKLIAQLRVDLGVPNLPFIAGQMTYEFRYPAASQAILDSRAAIDAIHKAITTRIPNTAFAPGPGPGFTDTNAGTTHYNAVGQRINGRNFYDAFMRARNGNTTTPADAATPVAPIAAPTLTAGTPTGSTVPVTIGSVTNATAYDVEYKLTSVSTWTVATTSAAAGAYTITGLTAGTGYNVRARARSAAGPGPYSTTINATTVAAGAGPTFTQRYSNGFTTTSTSSLPGFTDITNDGLGRVDANGAYIQGTGTTVAQRLFTPPTQPSGNDQYVDVAFSAVGGSSGRSPYAYLRATITGTAASTAYFTFYDSTTGGMRLYRIVNNANTTEITPATGAATAQPSTFRFAAVGTAVSVYVNGSSTPLFTVTDTNITAGVTYIGFRYTNTGDLAQRARSFANGDITP